MNIITAKFVYSFIYLYFCCVTNSNKQWFNVTDIPCLGFVKHPSDGFNLGSHKTQVKVSAGLIQVVRRI